MRLFSDVCQRRVRYRVRRTIDMRGHTMHETDEDLQNLRELIERSIERAGPFLRSSFEMPEHSLSAEQVSRYLQGIPTVAFATVTARGEPRVAPIGAIFYRGRFYIPTTMESARVGHVCKRPGVSLTLFESIGLAIIVHGQGVVLGQDHPDFATLVELQVQHSGESVNNWGTGAFVRVDADVMFTYARDPGTFPHEPRDEKQGSGSP